uniref:Protein shisa-5 n=1 Tax=Pogona vitticeps TaxID=103695 RepID=A0A6J0TZ68_9SAUR
MAFAPGPFLLRLLRLGAFLGVLSLLPSRGLCENCKTYKYTNGRIYLDTTCEVFCCGNCNNQYCCSDPSKEFNAYDQLMCHFQPSESSTYPPILGKPMKFGTYVDDWRPPGPSGTIIAVGVSIFILFIVTIVVCFTCSCCCLYNACRRSPRPVVTTTSSTTVVQVPYPQQPGVPAAYPVGGYQGYNPLPVQPQPGIPAAPYPTQYPPPYVAQPSGPPAYHETMAAGAGAPTTQPPYNPAYMDPTKHSY